MVKIDFQGPMLISGVIITENILNELRWMQTGERWLNDAAKFENQGYNEMKTDLCDIGHEMIEAYLNLDTESEEGKKMLDKFISLHFIRNTISRLKIPDELIK